MFIVILAICVGLILFLFKKQYIRKRGEPVLISGLPFIGVGIQYGTNAPSFLEKCRQKYGNIFTLFLFGKRLTFVLDPNEFSQLFKKSKLLEFHPIATDISEKVFLIPALDQSLVELDFNRQLKMHLNGDDLNNLSLAFDTQLKRTIPEFAQKKWTSNQIFDFCKRIFFQASVVALYGENVDPKVIYDDFILIDDHFHILASGMSFLVPTAVFKAYKRITDYLKSVMTPDKNKHVSALIQARHDTSKANGLSCDSLFRYHFAILWGSQANTQVAAFWTLTHILQHPSVYQKLMSRENVDDAKCVYLDACINETLRLSSGSLVIRKAADQVDFKTQGKNYKIRKDDFVVIPTLSMHSSHSIHDKPEIYDPQRFLTPDKSIKNSGLIAFGGGVSMCPGRHFARNEIRIFVMEMLKAFEFKDLNSALALDEKRFGLGTIPPKTDIPFRYRSRV